MKNVVLWINRQYKLWFAALLAVLAFNGCHSGGGGCSRIANDIQPEAGPKSVDKNFDFQLVQAFGNEYARVLNDHQHDCEYVVINSSVFVWRGTNLLAYTGPHQ